MYTIELALAHMRELQELANRSRTQQAARAAAHERRTPGRAARVRGAVKR